MQRKNEQRQLYSCILSTNESSACVMARVARPDIKGCLDKYTIKIKERA